MPLDPDEHQAGDETEGAQPLGAEGGEPQQPPDEPLLDAGDTEALLPGSENTSDEPIEGLSEDLPLEPEEADALPSGNTEEGEAGAALDAGAMESLLLAEDGGNSLLDESPLSDLPGDDSLLVPGSLEEDLEAATALKATEENAATEEPPLAKAPEPEPEPSPTEEDATEEEPVIDEPVLPNAPEPEPEVSTEEEAPTEEEPPLEEPELKEALEPEPEVSAEEEAPTEKEPPLEEPELKETLEPEPEVSTEEEAPTEEEPPLE